jgi:DNA repair ATPase RecN
MIHWQHLSAFLAVRHAQVMLTRHTTMVVGNTGGGKSVVIDTLAQAQTKLDLVTKRCVICVCRARAHTHTHTHTHTRARAQEPPLHELLRL